MFETALGKQFRFSALDSGSANADFRVISPNDRYTMDSSHLDRYNYESINFSALYEISRCHDVILVDKNGKLELYIDEQFEHMPSHNDFQNKLSSVEPIKYIKYLSRDQHHDLHDCDMPVVDIIKYYHPLDNSKLNLPGKILKPVTMCNGTSQLYLTPKQYEDYIKINPKYLVNHKYILISHSKIKVDYYQYYIDNDDESTDFYFYILNRKLKIIKKEEDLNEEWCPFIKKAVDKMLDEFDSVHYNISSYDNFNDTFVWIRSIVGHTKKLKWTIDYAE